MKNIRQYMKIPTILSPNPARIIRSGQRGVRGSVPRFGRFESALERDLMELLRFGNDVREFYPQPISIPYVSPNGAARKYTPDGLIYFRHELKHPPVLYEVKYREDYKRSWRELRPKFRAARQLCLEEGWRFRVFTEFHIRTPYLANAKFLWAYKETAPSQEVAIYVLDVMEDLKEADVDMLLCALARDRWRRAELIPIIWHLVAIKAIHCDLDEPLTMKTVLTATGDADVE
jgi:hypothetical protein